MSVTIIAEAGVNHNGDLGLAKELICAASEAGADIVKFQAFTADSLATKLAPKADYQLQTTNKLESQHSMLKRLELDYSSHMELAAYAKVKGIEFLSTAFDLKTLDWLVKLGIGRLKIPSGEITNLPYLRQAARYGLPIILSTGMSTLGEVESALNVIVGEGVPRGSITVLHCTSNYPTYYSDVNLKSMLTMGIAFGVNYGYSDHTLGIEVPIAAVSMGACIIEKHFTLDRDMQGPDHSASLTPEELKSMVLSIRNIEQSLGDGIKRPVQAELETKLMARKSIVAIKKISKGEAFTAENIGIKRPGTGVSPMSWDDVLGKTAPVDFSPDDLIRV